MPTQVYDVIIIGGSYAGLSAAMALGRSRRNVLIINSGLPCNRQTPATHNMITLDGAKPGDILSVAREQVLFYKTIRFINDKAKSARKDGADFIVVTASEQSYTARKLIFSSGVSGQHGRSVSQQRTH